MNTADPREQEEACPECGYDLSGVRGERCPECGVVITIAAAAAKLAAHRRRIGRWCLGAPRSSAFSLGL